MTTLLVADLHLDESRPALIDTFLRFLARDARDAAMLYILGDLFETWIGDDDDAPLARRIADALSTLARAGVPIRFIHGNRDFLLGPAYAARCGMELLPESTVLELEGRPTLLMHGDTLCTADVAYQQFRLRSRDPAWQQGVLAQPLEARRALAASAREESARHTATSLAAVMDVTPAAVAAALDAAGVSRLIHGHTHRRAIHALGRAGSAERIVLGDWYERGSALSVTRAGVRFFDL